MMLRMLLAAWLCGAYSGASARDLTVVYRGAVPVPALQEAFVAPWTAAGGAPPAVLGWPGGLGTVRARVLGGPDDWDLVLVSADELLGGCDEGLFEHLPWPALGGRDHYLPATTSDCGAGAQVSSLALAWDRDKFPSTPSWADFWDVARYPGKRGLRHGARGNLEFALLADGVSTGDVYRILRTDDGVDRAFRKLDQIKPYLVWWRPSADAVQSLASGEVLMSSADTALVTAANRTTQRHLGVQWTGSLTSLRSWAVMKNSAAGADAARFLAFMGDPARQAAFSTALPYGPTARGATDLLPPEVLANSPSAPANLAAAVPVDEQFWRDNGERLGQRYDSWLAH